MPKYPDGEFNQQQYVNDYKKENYDEMRFLVPKGRRDDIKALVKEKHFSSISALVVTAIEQQFNINISTPKTPKK